MKFTVANDYMILPYGKRRQHPRTKFCGALRKTHNGYMENLTPGSLVAVIAYGGETLIRRVVAVRLAHVVVCNEKEYGAAAREGRAPIGVGFPKVDVTPYNQGGVKTRHEQTEVDQTAFA